MMDRYGIGSSVIKKIESNVGSVRKQRFRKGGTLHGVRLKITARLSPWSLSRP